MSEEAAGQAKDGMGDQTGSSRRPTRQVSLAARGASGAGGVDEEAGWDAGARYANAEVVAVATETRCQTRRTKNIYPHQPFYLIFLLEQTSWGRDGGMVGGDGTKEWTETAASSLPSCRADRSLFFVTLRFPVSIVIIINWFSISAPRRRRYAYSMGRPTTAAAAAAEMPEKFSILVRHLERADRQPYETYSI